jgi:hypothetical protein
MPPNTQVAVLKDDVTRVVYTLTTAPDGTHTLDIDDNDGRVGFSLDGLEGYERVLEDDIVLPVNVAEKVLGESRWTLARRRQEPAAGGLPYVKLSAQRIGYRLGDIRRFLWARRVGRLPNETPPEPESVTVKGNRRRGATAAA